MIRMRRAADRGHFDHGWLKTWHTFSFADYRDPEHMGFQSLRVLNEDRVQAGKGFGTHPHRDMEIVTYLLSGVLEHQDSMGNGSVIRPGDVQRMTAGTGVMHSEFNPSADEDVHLLQIWILPDAKGHEPGYEQTHFPAESRRDRLCLVASGDGSDGSVRIYQDARIHASLLGAGQAVVHSLSPGRHAWVQLMRGGLTVNDEALGAGDGAALSDEDQVSITATDAAEFLLFDLAGDAE